MKSFALITILALFATTTLYAKPQKQDIKPRITISDGKDGRQWGQFNQNIQERPVQKIGLVVTRTSGGDDTYVNIRFGKNGKTLENGKRGMLNGSKKTVIWWNVNQSPNGQPLVINAYKGEVRLDVVSIMYSN